MVARKSAATGGQLKIAQLGKGFPTGSEPAFPPYPLQFHVIRWLLVNEHELPTELREFEEGEESSASRKGYRRLERSYPKVRVRQRPTVMNDMAESLGFFLNPETSREPKFESPFSLRSIRAIIQL
jgi:hypothetical protein